MFNPRRIGLILAALGILVVAAVGFSNTRTVEAGYVSTGDGSWVWLNPLPQGNDLNGVSCVNSSFCVAVGNNGTILAYSDTIGWRAQASGTTKKLTAVSCPTLTTCFAVGEMGTILKYDGTSWTTQASPLGGTLGFVNCPPGVTTLCFAGLLDIDFAWELRYDGVSWTLDSGISLRSSISCANATFCVGTGIYAHNAAVFNGTTWTDIPNSNDGEEPSVSCSSPTFCLIVTDGGISGNANAAAIYNGTTWTPIAVNIDSIYGTFASVSCLSPTLCFVITTNNHIFKFDGSTFTPQNAAYGSRFMLAISCGSSSACFVVGVPGFISYYNGNYWSGDTRFAQTSIINSISCTSTTFCGAATGYGYGPTSFFNGISWISIPDDTNFYRPIAISCVNSSFCAGVGNGYSLYIYNGIKWTKQNTPSTPLNFFAVSCSSTSRCVAVGEISGVLRQSIYDGTSWSSSQSIQQSGVIHSISCPSANLCFAVGDAGQILKYDGANWTVDPYTSANNNLIGVSCSSPTSCIAVGGGSNSGRLIAKYNGTTWADQVNDPNGTVLLAVSCSSSTSCMAVGSAGVIASYNGTTWAAETSGVINDLDTVSCVNASYCVVGGKNGAILAKVKLTVNSTATTNTPGTLVYALAHATEPQIINFDLPGGSVINLAGQVPVIPAGVIVRGSCGVNGPGITLNVTNVTGGIGVSGGNALYGLKITSSNGKLLSLLGTGNKLGCVSLIKT